MKCPLCKENITDDAIRCEKCGFTAPCAVYFADTESFFKWKSQTEAIDCEPFAKLPGVSAVPEQKPAAPVSKEPVPISVKPPVQLNPANEAKSANTASVDKPAKIKKADCFPIHGKAVVTYIISLVGMLILGITWFFYFLMEYYQYLDYKYLFPSIFLLWCGCSAWLILLVAFLVRRFKWLMTAGLMRLAASGLLIRIILYVIYEYQNYDLTLINVVCGLFTISEVFVPALMLLIKFRKGTKLLWSAAGWYSVLCFGVFLIYQDITVFSLTRYVFLTCFFFAAGRCIHLSKLSTADNQVPQT